MSFPIYEHTKSREYFDRATKVIPSGVYGHLGPAEGNFIPVSDWPLFGDHAKGTYFWDVDDNKYIDYMCAYPSSATAPPPPTRSWSNLRS